ncbi:MAG: NERD domain-containing protein [Oscillospiraceae bacterium]|nr:NERD domain-containing protein [Oscillospiraceae bacterium]
MGNIEKIYQDLTNVDIQQQQELWDERGKGYYGEFLVFRELYPDLPGNCKILMNIQIPVTPGKTTEIDLLLIHETGLYVFEMKHYKGTIYGDPQRRVWTQYFRTAPNHTFRNPIEQNRYHIQALQNRYPQIPIHSLIVFTSPECDLRATCDVPDITLCRLSNLMGQLRTLTSRPSVLDMERLDGLFRDLMQFSPMMQKTVTVTGEPLPFHKYATFIADRFKEDLAQQEADYQTAVQRLQKTYAEKSAQVEATCRSDAEFAKIRSRAAILTAALVCVGCIVVSFLTCKLHQTHCDQQVSAAQEELAQFAQKFQSATFYESEDITMTEDFITVSNLQLTPSNDVENAVNFGFTLDWNGEYYGASIDRDTTLIVARTDGSIKEYAMPDGYFPYTSSSELLLGEGNAWYTARPTWEFPVYQITDTPLEDISYIKLTSLDIWVMESGKPTVVASGYEVEIYNQTNSEG